MRLTNQLLSQAMVIHRADAQPDTRLDPRALLRDLLVELLSAPRFAAVDLTFDDSGMPARAAMILGDPVSLREALRNLIENAVTHGAADVAISVTLTAEADNVTLTVADDGPGLPEAARVQAFDRFRTGTTSGGSGLGLAIVAEVAQAHGASLTLADSPADGLAVSLAFPRAGPAPEGPDPARRQLLTGIGAATLALPFVARPAAAATPVTIWSATDTAAFLPLIEEFNRQHPEIALRYRSFETRTLHRAIRDGAGEPDLVISLALDLQVDLVNRGLARPLPALPVGPASWRRELFGFTLEPEVMILNTEVFAHLPEPRSHAALADLVRDHADVLSGRLGTYDIRRSGIGYLLSTQASALGPDHARLTEIMGQTGTRLFDTTGDMVSATTNGTLALAVGALGPYANAALRDDPRARLLLFDDYNLALPRTGFVHRDAAQPEAAEAFLGYLLSPAGQRVLETVPDLAPLAGPAWLTGRQRASLRRMAPGPGLLLWQDRMKREAFVEDWAHSIGARKIQP
ncbi:ATP-binding protein [Maritimibacter alkaliphilus]|uniref:ATP-binding protein n=1 Tax=Maritimibacter alkaliphilus TaxID=404236 RepID=UPI0039655CAF